MRRLILLAAACGSPAHRVPPPPPAPATVEAPPPAPITCGEVGVILRGKVEDDRDAGPMKEVAIARACLHDHWTAEVIACIGGVAEPAACLTQLSPAQRIAYAKKLISWNDQFPDETTDVIDDPAALDDVDCNIGIGDVTRYAPPLALQGADQEYAGKLRGQAVRPLCDDWSMEQRRCFDQQRTTPEVCRATLAPDQRTTLTARLAEADALMTRVQQLSTTRGAPACKQVVAAHYGDARWKGKLVPMKAAERKQAIAASRASLLKACTGWSGQLRACVVAGGGDPCFVAAGIPPEAWGYPAGGVPIKTGIAECDAYGDTIRALVTCSGIPREATRSMLESFQHSAPTFASTPVAQRGTVAAACKQADAAIRQSALSLGCTI